MGDTLRFPQGTRYLYSSHGYNLLGFVMERAAGADFRSLVAAEVMVPLRISSVAAHTVGISGGEVTPWSPAAK